MTKRFHWLCFWIFISLFQKAAITTDLVEEKDSITVYHIGNSLTRNLSLFRLVDLFKAKGIDYYFGSRMGAGITLGEFYSGQYYGNPIKNSGYENRPLPLARISDDLKTEKFYGHDWREAFQKHCFDAVILQHYQDYLQYEPSLMNQKGQRTHHFGSLPAFIQFIDYISGHHQENQHLSSKNIYLYATWPRVEKMVQNYNPSEGVLHNPTQADYDSYSRHWEQISVQPSSTGRIGETGPSKSFYDQFLFLVNRHRKSKYDHLPDVKMIPVGHVLYALDKKIKQHELPGIKTYFERNWKYFKKARYNSSTQRYEFPFDISRENPFRPEWGVINFYCDSVHMNDQPHDGATEGTIGAYVASQTIYSVLTGQAALGCPVSPWESFDPKTDKDLIEALQRTIDAVIEQVKSNHQLQHVQLNVRFDHQMGYAAGSGWYPQGTSVPLRAFPKEGFDFDRWEGPVNDTKAMATTIKTGAEPLDVKLRFKNKSREVQIFLNEKQASIVADPTIWKKRVKVVNRKGKPHQLEYLSGTAEIGSRIELPQINFLNHALARQDKNFPFKGAKASELVSIKSAHQNRPLKLYLSCTFLNDRHPHYNELKSQLIDVTLDLGEAGRYASFHPQKKNMPTKTLSVLKGNNVGLPKIYYLQDSHILAGWEGGSMEHVQKPITLKAKWLPKGTPFHISAYHFGSEKTAQMTPLHLSNMMKSQGITYHFGRYLLRNGTLGELARDKRFDLSSFEKSIIHNVEELNPYHQYDWGVYGSYNQAFQHYTFDALIFEHHRHWIKDREDEDHYLTEGCLQGIQHILNQALNSNNSAPKVYIMATWPSLNAIQSRKNDNIQNYHEFWQTPFDPKRKHAIETVCSADFYSQLLQNCQSMMQSNTPHLASPVLIKVGHVLHQLDKMLMHNKLDELIHHLGRHEKHYGPYEKNKGILNIYIQNSLFGEGSLGAWICAATSYAAITNQSCMHLNTNGYPYLDEELDRDLLHVLKKVIDQIQLGL